MLSTNQPTNTHLTSIWNLILTFLGDRFYMTHTTNQLLASQHIAQSRQYCFSQMSLLLTSLPEKCERVGSLCEGIDALMAVVHQFQDIELVLYANVPVGSSLLNFCVRESIKHCNNSFTDKFCQILLIHAWSLYFWQGVLLPRYVYLSTFSISISVTETFLSVLLFLDAVIINWL